MAASNCSIPESSELMRKPHAVMKLGLQKIPGETKQVKVKNFHKEILVAIPEPSEQNPRPVFYSSSFEEAYKEFADSFYLTKYKNTDNHPGVAVTFNVKVDEQSYMLCSVEKNGPIRFTSGEIPETIDGPASELIFFQTAFLTSSKGYKFESSLFPGSYMTSEKVNEKTHLYLKACSGEVPEICKLAIEYSDK